MDRDTSTELLRARIQRVLRPVKPLRRSRWRALAAAPWLVASLALLLVTYGLRPDAGQIGLLLWAAAAVQVIVGLVLLSAALDRSVPASGATRFSGAILTTVGLAAQIVASLVIFVPAPVREGLAPVLPCLVRELAVGFPVMLLGLWLLSRGLPLSPWIAGALAGMAGGVAGDALWRLICPVASPSHFLVAHTLAVAMLCLAGAVAGGVWGVLAGRDMFPAGSMNPNGRR